MKSENLVVSGIVDSFTVSQTQEKGTLYSKLSILVPNRERQEHYFNVFLPKKLSSIIKKDTRITLGMIKSGGLWGVFYAFSDIDNIQHAIYELREGILDFRKKNPTDHLSGIQKVQNYWLLLLTPAFFLSSLFSSMLSVYFPSAFSFELCLISLMGLSLLSSYLFLSYRGLWSDLPSLRELRSNVQRVKKEFRYLDKIAESKVA